MKAIFFSSPYSRTRNGFFVNSCADSLRQFLVDFDSPGLTGEFLRLRAAAKLIMDEVEEPYAGAWDRNSRYSKESTLELSSLFEAFDKLETQNPDRWLQAFVNRNTRGDIFDRFAAEHHARHATIEQVHEAFDQLYPLDKLSKLSTCGDAIFLSTDPKIALVYARTHKTMTPESTLAILAMSGIQVALPRIYCRPKELLAELKDKFKDAREEYVAHLRDSLAKCHQAIQSGQYKDAWEFAQWEINQQLLGKLHKFEKAVSQGDKTLLRSISLRLGTEAPTIVQSLLTKNFVLTGKILLKVLYESIKGGTALTKANDDFPMVSYIYKLKSISES